MRLLFLGAAALALTACSTAPVLLGKSADGRDFLATDSKLRIVTTSDQGIWSTAGLVEAKRITCTEPSPDVATTIANSFGAGVGLFGRGSASISAQQVEGLVQLGERTAAIQLLRDKMYQTCLAYSNGAISGTTYSLIMSRLDDAIVTLSLADGAAGAFGRKLGALGGEASASGEASVSGLPGEIAKIEDQASRLAAANKKVDDAAKALEAHKSAKPVEGKEQDYNKQTTDLEAALVTAKAERNALLELMRATANSAAKAGGKISEVQAGGSIGASPNAQVLRDMHGEFLLADSSRDLIFACMVELGLRGDGSGDDHLEQMTRRLERYFDRESQSNLDAKAEEMTWNRVDYAGAILRARSTALAKLCVQQLPTLISEAAKRAHDYRQLRAELSARTATARYAGEKSAAEARLLEVRNQSIKLCNTEFKDDPPRRTACLDKVVPTAEASKPNPKPAGKPPA